MFLPVLVSSRSINRSQCHFEFIYQTGYHKSYLMSSAWRIVSKNHGLLQTLILSLITYYCKWLIYDPIKTSLSRIITMIKVIQHLSVIRFQNKFNIFYNSNETAIEPKRWQFRNENSNFLTQHKLNAMHGVE